MADFQDPRAALDLPDHYLSLDQIDALLEPNYKPSEVGSSGLRWLHGLPTSIGTSWRTS